MAMKKIPASVDQLQKALSSCLNVEKLPEGLRQQMVNLQRAIEKQYGDQSGAIKPSARGLISLSEQFGQLFENKIKQQMSNNQCTIESHHEGNVGAIEPSAFEQSDESKIKQLLLNIYSVAKEGRNTSDLEWELKRTTKKLNHCLTRATPALHWSIYIDESGDKFSEQERGSNEGFVVAVCMRENEPLPDIGKFHCNSEPSEAVLSKFAVLLAGSCGILGMRQSTLNIQGIEGWLQSIRELIKWVWRLLPLPSDDSYSSLSIYIEQRGPYEADIKQYFMEKGGIGAKDSLRAELRREDSTRAEKICIDEFMLVDKNNSLIAWADVASYVWQKSKTAFMKVLEASGLQDVCFVNLKPNVLDICHKVVTGNYPPGEEWIQLMQAKAEPRTSVILDKALEVLQQKCTKEDALWKPYVTAMHEYLLNKDYEVRVLDCMADWLAPVRTKDLYTKFIWLSNQLRLHNHNGDANIPELNTVKDELLRILPAMSTLNTDAEPEVALRLAASDANAFSFAEAEARLAPWDITKGGHPINTALLEGKVLSSLGQYRAFQGDLDGACSLFRQALEQFEKLPEDRRRKESTQTRIYLAIAAMDNPTVGNEEVHRLVEDALEQDIPSFAACMKGASGIKDRYKHHLLTRYLSRRGTPEERAPYLKTQQFWMDFGKGFDAGHPWPIIQYHRYLMTDKKNLILRKALAKSMQQAKGEEGGLTLEIITLAISLSIGLVDLHSDKIVRRLREIADTLPDSKPFINKMLAPNGYGELLAQRVLPFNYC